MHNLYSNIAEGVVMSVYVDLVGRSSEADIVHVAAA